MPVLSANIYNRDIHAYLERRISFYFLEQIHHGEGKAIEQSQEFFLFLDTAIKNDAFVSENISTYRFLKTYISDRIISASWALKDRIYDALVAEDRFDFTKDMTINCLNFLLVLRDVIFCYNRNLLHMFDKYRYEEKSFIEEKRNILSDVVNDMSVIVPKISPTLFHMGAKIFIPYQEGDTTVPFICRLAAVFSHLAQMLSYSEYQQGVKGSLSINRSLLNTIFYNAEFFGLDRLIVKDMLTFISAL